MTLPAVLIESDPRSVLHVVAVLGGRSHDEWIYLHDLDQLAHPPVIGEAILRSVAEYRGPQPGRRVGRTGLIPTGSRPSMPGSTRAERCRVRRSGPSEVISFWSFSAIVKVPVTGPAGTTRSSSKRPVSGFAPNLC